jgi:hypothetical protein
MKIPENHDSIIMSPNTFKILMENKPTLLAFLQMEKHIIQSALCEDKYMFSFDSSDFTQQYPINVDFSEYQETTNGNN